MTAITELERRPEEEPEQELALADLDLPEESARDVAGGTRPGGGGCDEFGCGGNHNEVLAVTEDEDAESENELALADLDLPEESARDVTGGAPSGCDEFGCGTNHNEVLAVTA